MRIVEDESGKRYLLEERRESSWRVYDPTTGETTERPAAEMRAVEGAPLAVAAERVPEAVRALVAGVPSARALGLLVELDRRGPLAARTLLAETELCESDLHGVLGELRAAGLVAESDVAGERGYRLTERASESLAAL